MPVCPHDCRKGSFAFCPTELGIMGGLKSCELKNQRRLDKALVACWEAVHPREVAKKVIFKSTQHGVKAV